MKNRILILLLLAALVFSLIGCAECIDIEHKDVEVTVVDEHYSAAWMQPFYNGKTMMFLSHPADYHITVDYNGIEYTINDHDTYDKYKDKIGQTAIGKLEIRTYNDGTVKYDIVSLG